jgi:hypothetical protein
MDAMVGCGLLSFLDCYSGYHQILLKVKDQIKTSFITPFSTFCFTTLSFRLKSVGAMYQRGLQNCLHCQLMRNTEAYIDDVVVKTQEDEGPISDLAETLDNMRKFKMGKVTWLYGLPMGNLSLFVIMKLYEGGHEIKRTMVT